MSKLFIKDKICSHCQGNEWYVNNNIYSCVKKAKENSLKNYNKEKVLIRLKKYYKTDEGKNKKQTINKKLYQIHKKNLSETFIKRTIKNSIYSQTKSSVKNIKLSDRDIIVYKNILLIKSILKNENK